MSGILILINKLLIVLAWGCRSREKNQGNLFSTNYKADLIKFRALFFTKNCLFCGTYVVSLVVEKYFLFLSLSFSIVALLRLNKLFKL